MLVVGVEDEATRAEAVPEAAEACIRSRERAVAAALAPTAEPRAVALEAGLMEVAKALVAFRVEESVAAGKRARAANRTPLPLSPALEAGLAATARRVLAAERVVDIDRALQTEVHSS